MIVGIFFLSCSVCFAQTDVYIDLNPNAAYRGEIFRVSVRVSEINGVNNGLFNFQYDSNIFNLKSTGTPTSVLSAAEFTVNPEPSSLNSLPGEVRVFFENAHISDSGEDILFTFELEIKPSASFGTTNISIPIARVVGEDVSNPILGELKDANFPVTILQETGTIIVNPEPNEAGATWELTLPDGSKQIGTGDQNLLNMPIGEYTLSWGNVSGWNKPVNPPGQTLDKDGIISFSGTYIQQVGTVILDPLPTGINAPWTLILPNGSPQTGSGYQTLPNMPVGNYQLTWGTHPGWDSPSNPAPQELIDNGTITFSDLFIQQTATVVIDPNPNSINASWKLTLPDLSTQNGQGDQTLNDMPVGDYQLTWDPVLGWDSPSNPAPQNLTKDGTIIFADAYIQQKGTVVINPDPDSISAQWILTLPDGSKQNGVGDKTLNDMPAGNYQLTWESVSGWDSPANPSSQNLTKDGTITFSGTYIQQTGIVVINPNPDHISAPWELTLPDGSKQNGSGDQNLSNMPVGEYTLSWGDATDWVKPTNPPNQTLSKDGTITFTGTYTELSSTVIIDPQPASINASWTLTLPDTTIQTGTGPQTLSKMPIGDYTLVWGTVLWWDTPSNQAPQTLTENGTITFTATYIQQTGTVEIDPNPDSITAPWILTYPDGKTLSDSGDQTLNDVPAGTYQLTWEPVTGWDSPVNPSSQDLTKDGTITFSDTYVQQTGTINIDSNPDSLSAPWILTLPDSTNQSGVGDQNLADMPVGEYSLVWDSVSGWNSPSPPSPQTLAKDGSITFTGDYVQQVGTVIVNPEPDIANSTWTLIYPDTSAISGTGNQTLQDQPVGNYSITWDPVSGWGNPAPSPGQLLSDAGTITFEGTYTQNNDTILIFVDPEEATWTLTRPDRSNETGQGDRVFVNMPTGNYTIHWEELNGWNQPNPDTETLTLVVTGPPITFTGMYMGSLILLNNKGQLYNIGNTTPIVDLGFSLADAKSFEITPSGNGYIILDRFGRLTGSGDETPTLTGDFFGFDIARDIEFSPSGNGSYVLSGFGFVHTFGDAVYNGSVFLGTIWRPIDGAVDMELTPTGQGYYILDAWGNVYAFGDAILYKNQFMGGAASDIEVAPDGSGYLILDRTGRVHGFGSLESITQILSGSNPTFTDQSAIDLKLHLDTSNIVDGWYILDEYGDIYSVGAAPTVESAVISSDAIFVDME